MKSAILIIFLSGMFSQFLVAGESAPAPKMKEETVSYQADGVPLKGLVVYDENITEKRPAILVVPEWWGLNDYIKNRARQLAELGYVAMAVDIFGNGKNAADPAEAQELVTPFYQNPQSAKKRLDAAINKIRQYKQTDQNNIAAIGYCFGGSVVLNAAKLGSPFKGVVSFHGILAGVPPKKDLLKAKVLICHGEDDKFVSSQDVDKFKHQMDSVNADYQFKSYPNATHAFTNPNATPNGKKFNIPIAYNAEADKNSWKDMKSFFNQLFMK